MTIAIRTVKKLSWDIIPMVNILKRQKSIFWITSTLIFSEHGLSVGPASSDAGVAGETRTRCYGGLWLWLSLRTAAALRTLVIELEPSFDLVRSAVELVRRKLSYRRYYQPGSGHNLIEVWFNYCLRIFSSEIYLVYNSVYLVLPGCQLPEAWVRENLISNGGNKFSD